MEDQCARDEHLTSDQRINLMNAMFEWAILMRKQSGIDWDPYEGMEVKAHLASVLQRV